MPMLTRAGNDVSFRAWGVPSSTGERGGGLPAPRRTSSTPEGDCGASFCEPKVAKPKRGKAAEALGVTPTDVEKLMGQCWLHAFQYARRQELRGAGGSSLPGSSENKIKPSVDVRHLLG